MRSIAVPVMSAAIAFGLGASHAAEQPYPVRPVRIIVSNATGSSPEIMARMLANKLHAEIMRVLRSPEIVELVRKQGATAQPESPAAFAQYIREERNRIAGLAKSAGIRID